MSIEGERLGGPEQPLLSHSPDEGGRGGAARFLVPVLRVIAAAAFGYLTGAGIGTLPSVVSEGTITPLSPLDFTNSLVPWTAAAGASIAVLKRKEIAAGVRGLFNSL